MDLVGLVFGPAELVDRHIDEGILGDEMAGSSGETTTRMILSNAAVIFE